MNKTVFIDAVASKSGMMKTEASAAVDAVINTISDLLEAGEDIQLIGFGTFTIETRAEKKGRNPQTGKDMIIPAKKVAKWKPSKKLKL